MKHRHQYQSNLLQQAGSQLLDVHKSRRPIRLLVATVLLQLQRRFIFTADNSLIIHDITEGGSETLFPCNGKAKKEPVSRQQTTQLVQLFVFSFHTRRVSLSQDSCPFMFPFMLLSETFFS